MNPEVKELRLKLLHEIDTLQENCKPCETRKMFDNAKDATGLSRACKQCPIGLELSKYGDKLSKTL